jgi:hypothetical protein
VNSPFLARVAVAVIAGLLAAADVAPKASLQLAAPAEMRVGDRASLAIALQLPVGAAAPVLVTQSAEGEALDVVRGPAANPLKFEVTLHARARGTSILRVHALAYVCQPDCRAIEAEATAGVVVITP